MKSICGLEENPDKNLQEKIIGLAREELGVEIQEEEIEIANRIGQTRRLQNKPIAIKFLSNKSKMQQAETIERKEYCNNGRHGIRSG